MPDFVWNGLYNGIRSLAFTFDSVVYTLINYCYKIILYLSNIDLSNFGGVSALVSRIYILLGIFMLFKLAFSIIQYVVAPDSFTDSGKGFGKLATNVMVSMALLVATPWLFSVLYEAQGYILESNVIGRLIMGSTTATTDNNTKMSVDKISSMANDTEFLLYGAFASLNTDIITDCQDGDTKANIMGTTQQITINQGECLKTLNNEFTGEDLKATHVSLYNFFKYKDGDVIKDDRDIGAFGNLITWQKDSEYVINYIPFISALVGGYVAFLLIAYCIDIALRAVKLLFLQMVAPISIISYIDPKESISNSKLSNWLKEVFSTWASLFIRLLVIFLVMQLVSIIATGVLGDGSMINNESIDFGTAGAPGGVTQMFIYVFLVIGGFQFAKKAPELIEKLFGIKMTGELRLADAGKTLLGGAVGAGVGGIASGIATASYAGINGKNKLGAFASGFAKGTIGGAVSGGHWDGKSGKSLLKNPLGVSGNLARYYGAKQGTTFGSRRNALFSELIGGVQPSDALKARIDAGKRFESVANSFDEDLVKKANKMNTGKFRSYVNGEWTNEEDKNTWEQIEQYKNLKEQLKAAEQRGDHVTAHAIREGKYVGEYQRSDGTYGNFDNLKGKRFDDTEDDIKEVMNNLIQAGFDNPNAKLNSDEDFRRIVDKRGTLERIASENSNAFEFSGVGSLDSVKNINDAKKSVVTNTQITENSPKYEDAKQSADAIKDSAAYRHFRN